MLPSDYDRDPPGKIGDIMTTQAQDLIRTGALLDRQDGSLWREAVARLGETMENDRTARDLAILEASQNESARHVLAHLCAVLIHEGHAVGQARAVLATLHALVDNKARAIELGRQSGERLGELTARMCECEYTGREIADLLALAMMSND